MPLMPPPMVFDRLQRVEVHPSRRRYAESRSAAKSMRIWRRVLANAIDLTAYGLCVFGWHFVIIAVSGFSSYAQSEERAPPEMLVSIIWISGWFLFGILGELLIMFWFNTTLGKAIMGLMIVDARPDRWFLSTDQIVRRTLTKTTIFYGVGVSLPWLIDLLIWRGIFPWAFLALNAVLMFVLLGIHREDRRGLHDRFAETELIRS